MTIRIYGDITLDNYEYEHPGDFTKTYQTNLDLKTHPYPGLSKRIRNRFVVRQFGGAYLLAQNLAVALASWNKGKVSKKGDFDPNTTKKGLHELPPWSGFRKTLKGMQEVLARNPAAFDDILNLFYRVSKVSDNSYRVRPEGYEGFTLPIRRHKDQELFRCLLGSGVQKKQKTKAPSEEQITFEDDDQATLCVFNDGGIRLRQGNAAWLESEPWAKSPDRGKTWAIVKSHEPKVDTARPSSFFNKLINLLPNRVVFVMNADDLRRNGVAISSSLSWERSVNDLVSQIETQKILGPDVPTHLVITFDFDAAMYLHTSQSKENATVEQAILVYSTNRGEGEYQSELNGSMPGAQTIFTSVLSGLIHTHFLEHPEIQLQDSSDLIEKILTYALIAKQRMLKCGFQPVTDNNMFTRVPKSGYNNGVVRLIPTLMYHESVFALPPLSENESSDDQQPPEAMMPSTRRPDAFSYPLGRDDDTSPLRQLRKDQSAYKLSGVRLDKDWLRRSDLEIFDVFSNDLPQSPCPFVDYVRKGNMEIAGEEFPLPICNIGKIKTISSREIESLRAIRRLIHSYLVENDGAPTPLGLAVFGQPGTGKSFTVKSVFKTLQGSVKELVEGSFIECNLSGFSDPEDLSIYFQTARDLRLAGKVPVLFFDEFDCSVDRNEFYWLKHFLAPLQDGVFTSGHMTHPIGKSIFVFAGSVSSTFNEFGEKFLNGDSNFVHSKGRDFLSRLQGHIDIGGLWPIHSDGSTKEIPESGIFADREFRKFIMRRAILLREILRMRAPSIFQAGGGTEMADIDEKVVEAFLHEEKYLHGIRSIEAVIRMSSISGARRFTPECLPTKEQLQMHVSPEFYKRAFGLVL